MTHLAHIADRLLNTPLLILPEKASVIAAVDPAAATADTTHTMSAPAARGICKFSKFTPPIAAVGKLVAALTPSNPVIPMASPASLFVEVPKTAPTPM